MTVAPKWLRSSPSDRGNSVTKAKAIDPSLVEMEGIVCPLSAPA